MTEEEQKAEERKLEILEGFKRFTKVHDLGKEMKFEDAEQLYINLSNEIENHVREEIEERTVGSFKIKSEDEEINTALKKLKDMKVKEVQTAFAQVANAINLHFRSEAEGRLLKEFNIKTYKDE